MSEVSKIMLVPAPGQVPGCRLWGHGWWDFPQTIPSLGCISLIRVAQAVLTQSQEGKWSSNPALHPRTESEEPPSPAPVSRSLLFPGLLGMEMPIPTPTAPQ